MSSLFERYKLPILAVFAVVVIAIFIVFNSKDKSPSEEIDMFPLGEAEKEEITEEVESFIYVDIQGQVKNPGVYELEEGSLIKDVIELAGGLTPDADSDYISQNINQAQKLKDEDKIYIPMLGEVEKEKTGTEDVLGLSDNSNGKININKATVEELDSLPGIGPSYAQKIIDGRPYSSIEEITNVKGIGDSTFEKIKEKICV